MRMSVWFSHISDVTLVLTNCIAAASSSSSSCFSEIFLSLCGRRGGLALLFCFRRLFIEGPAVEDMTVDEPGEIQPLLEWE